MLNKTITLEQVLPWHPCCDREKILRLSHGKTELTVGEIIDLRFVPAKDKLWLLLREEIIPARTLHEFALWCAETTLTKANVTNERSWNALNVKRLWLDGKATDKELHAATIAAWNATRNAARYAAWNTARDDATIAARAAAMDAAWNAAWNAATIAARYAASAAASASARVAARHATRASALEAARRDAWATAKKDQLAKLKEMLEGTSLC